MDTPARPPRAESARSCPWIRPGHTPHHHFSGLFGPETARKRWGNYPFGMASACPWTCSGRWAPDRGHEFAAGRTRSRPCLDTPRFATPIGDGSGQHLRPWESCPEGRAAGVCPTAVTGPVLRVDGSEGRTRFRRRRRAAHRRLALVRRPTTGGRATGRGGRDFGRGSEASMTPSRVCAPPRDVADPVRAACVRLGRIGRQRRLGAELAAVGARIDLDALGVIRALAEALGDGYAEANSRGRRSVRCSGARAAAARRLTC